MTEPLIFMKRYSLLDPGPREWRLDGDTLVQRDPDGSEISLRIADITSVRLDWSGKGKTFMRHVCVVKSSTCDLTIDSLDATGIGEFEYSPDYTPFARALLARMKLLTPAAKIRVGQGAAGFISTVLLAAAYVAVCPFWALDFLGSGKWPAAALVIGVGGLCVFALCRGWKNRPRTYGVFDAPPYAVPEYDIPQDPKPT